MIEPRRTPIAWVESPLQLLCAAEYAAQLGRPIDVAFRLVGDQMSATAQELLDRGALFSSIEPYYGIPWNLLRSHRDWVIGDAFSGQFRAALAASRPDSITLIDDGDMSLHLASALLGEAAFSRPGQHEGTVARTLGGIARERMLRLAASGRLGMFTAFSHEPQILALAARDVDVDANSFAWLRSHPRPVDLPHARIVLGSAGVVDGLLDEFEYLAWVGDVAAEAPISYLPHRRESADGLARVEAIPSVTVVDSGLPAELTLAGTPVPLQIVSRRSSASTTLRAVLAGTGSTIGVHGATAPIAHDVPTASLDAAVLDRNAGEKAAR